MVSSRTKKYILIAEDDKFYSSVLKEKLTYEGFEVEVTEDGIEALKKLRQRKADLLLLDLIMPVKGGIDTLSDLRKDYELCDMQVIVISTIEDQDTFKKCKALGIISYIPKTRVPVDETVEMVKNYLG